MRSLSSVIFFIVLNVMVGEVVFCGSGWNSICRIVLGRVWGVVVGWFIIVELFWVVFWVCLVRNDFRFLLVLICVVVIGIM